MTDVDPFDEGVPRNGRGQPQIIPLKRGKPDPNAKLQSYTRASTFAGALDDGAGLATWKVRHAALGVALRPDLAKMIAALGTDLNAFEPEDKRNLDAIITTAHDVSGGNLKANHGTAVHSLTEDPFDDSVARAAIDEAMARDVQAYNDVLEQHGLRAVESEAFVVNDELKVAGTFDHIYETTRPVDVDGVTIPAGARLIGDKKTGTLHPGAVAIQLAVYARAKKYDHVTGERAPSDVSPQWGIVAHIPRYEGRADLHLIDLHAGWEAAKLAVKVRELNSAAGQRALLRSLGCAVVALPAATPSMTAAGEQAQEASTKLTETIRELANVDDQTFADAEAALHLAGLNPTPVPTLTDLIGQAATRDECTALWQANAAVWTQEHTDAVTARLAVIERDAA